MARDAIPLHEADPSVLRERGVPYPLGSVHSCPGPRVVRLMHVALIAAYIEPVAAALCGRSADPVRLPAMRLPTDSCLRTLYPRPDPPPLPISAERSPPALGSLCVHAQVPLVGTRGIDSADNVCLGSSVLVQPLLPPSALASVPCGCASALHASSVRMMKSGYVMTLARRLLLSSLLSAGAGLVGAEADGAERCPIHSFPVAAQWVNYAPTTRRTAVRIPRGIDSTSPADVTAAEAEARTGYG